MALEIHELNEDISMTPLAFEQFGHGNIPTIRIERYVKSGRIYAKRMTRSHGPLSGQYGIFAGPSNAEKIRSGVTLSAYHGLLCKATELKQVAEMRQFENVYQNSVSFDIPGKRREIEGRGHWVYVGANDCLAIKFNDGCHGVFAQYQSMVNAEFRLIWTNDFPIMTVVSTTGIENESQIFVDYGDAWWKN